MPWSEAPGALRDLYAAIVMDLDTLSNRAIVVTTTTLWYTDLCLLPFTPISHISIQPSYVQPCSSSKQASRDLESRGFPRFNVIFKQKS
jgi:hypothetical protein